MGFFLHRKKYVYNKNMSFRADLDDMQSRKNQFGCLTTEPLRSREGYETGEGWKISRKFLLVLIKLSGLSVSVG